MLRRIALLTLRLHADVIDELVSEHRHLTLKQSILLLQSSIELRNDGLGVRDHFDEFAQDCVTYQDGLDAQVPDAPFALFDGALCVVDLFSKIESLETKSVERCLVLVGI